jgi:glycine oxidase
LTYDLIVRVIVIGAGIIGVSVADALVRRGIDVNVLDMRAPGRGATQASAGVLAPFIEAHEDSPLLTLAVRSLDLYDPFIAGLRARATRPIEYARTGTLEVALTENETEHLQRSRRALDARRVATEWLDPNALRAFEPAISGEATAGLFTPSHGFVGVASLVDALVESSRLAGATFIQPVEAVRIDANRDRVAVQADDRAYDADWVVVATGSWTTRVRLAGASLPTVRPIRGQLLHTTWTTPLPRRSVWGTGCYTVPWSDGSLLVGATVEDVGFDEHSTVEGVAELTAAVQRLLPAAAKASVDAIRVGLRPSTPDGLPWIGPLAAAPRVIMAAGHFRNGVLLAPLTADLVATIIAGQTTDPALAVTTPNRPSAQ